jgi:hypothetical protein
MHATMTSNSMGCPLFAKIESCNCKIQNLRQSGQGAESARHALAMPGKLNRWHGTTALGSAHWPQERDSMQGEGMGEKERNAGVYAAAA